MWREDALAAVLYRSFWGLVEFSAVPPKHRQVTAYYLLVTFGNVSGAVAARAAGCSKQNISKAMRRVEELREDAGFDGALRAIEEKLMREA